MPPTDIADDGERDRNTDPKAGSRRPKDRRLRARSGLLWGPDVGKAALACAPPTSFQDHQPAADDRPSSENQSGMQTPYPVTLPSKCSDDACAMDFVDCSNWSR